MRTITTLPTQKVIFVITAIFLVITLIRYQAYFFSRLDPETSAQLYSTSQYVLGEASPQKISDSELYEFAGWAYWQGTDPTTINFEHPPLAKYYYGLFYHLVGNPYWGSLLLFAGVLLLLDQLSVLLKLGRLERVAVVALTASLSLFQVHTRYALLDLPQLFGSLLFFVSFLKLQQQPSRKWFLLLGVAIGVIVSAKYWFPWILGFLGLMMWQAVRTRQYWGYVSAVCLGAAIYLASYTVYFLAGNSLLDLTAFEIYRLNWFSGKTDSPRFLIFQTLFTGSYKVWWVADTYERTTHWSVLWPISFAFSIAVFVWSVIKKRWNWFLTLGYSFALFAVFCIGAASDRFFIQLLPFWILATVLCISRLIKIGGKLRRQK